MCIQQKSLFGVVCIIIAVGCEASSKMMMEKDQATHSLTEDLAHNLDMFMRFDLDEMTDLDLSLALDESEDTAHSDAMAPPSTCDHTRPLVPTPVGPLPIVPLAAQGVDAFEWPIYQRLREGLVDHPEIHFIATYDAQSGHFLLDGGEPDQRTQVRFERVDTFAGSSYEVIEGNLSNIFPHIDQRVYSDLESLYSVYEYSDELFYLDIGYIERDPRLGMIPRSDQVYPYPLERIATIFSAPHAPDVIYGLWPGLDGSRGSHGGLNLLQSRAMLMFGGAGARSNQMIERSANLTDVLPTVLAALGASTTGGIGRDGIYDDGL